MKHNKFLVVCGMCILCVFNAGAQTINGKLHNRFMGYGIDKLYVYLSMQPDRVAISQTYPIMQIPIDAAGRFRITFPNVNTLPHSRYTVREFLANCGVSGSNLTISNESTLVMMDFKVNAGNGTTSEYFGPCDDGRRGSNLGLYVYSSNALNISGSGWNGEQVQISFVRGWNLLVINNQTHSLYAHPQLFDSQWCWGSD